MNKLIETMSVCALLSGIMRPVNAQESPIQLQTVETTERLSTVLGQLAGPDAVLLCVRDESRYVVAVPTGEARCETKETSFDMVNICELEAGLPGLHPLSEAQPWLDCTSTTDGPITIMHCAEEAHDVPKVIQHTIIQALKDQLCTPEK